MQTILVLAALAAVACAREVCGGPGSGQVGLGKTQLCGYSPGDKGCGALDPTIFSGGCGVLAAVVQSGHSGYCSGGWGSGAAVDCENNGTPFLVHTPHNGDYENCIENTGPDDCASEGIGYYAGVDYCCTTPTPL